MLTKDMLGKIFKCRVVPHYYTYQYENPAGTFYTQLSSFNGLGQVYDQATQTTLEDKCLVIMEFDEAVLVNLDNIVAFDANCIFTHQSVAAKDHPLDASGLPVMVVVEVLSTGIAAQDGRLVRASNYPTSSTNVFLESKNTSNLTAWGNPKAKILYAPLNGPTFIGSEYYFGKVPAILDAVYAYSGNAINTHLAANFLDFSYGFEYTAFTRIEKPIALTADAEFTAGTRIEQYVIPYTIAYASYYRRSLGGIKNDYGHRNTVTSFMGSTYTSTAPDVDSSGSINQSSVQSSLITTCYDDSYTYKNCVPASKSVSGTETLTLTGLKTFIGTIVYGSDGRFVSVDLVQSDPGDVEILEVKKYCVLAHAI